MCGITGFWDQRNSRPSYSFQDTIEKMAQEISFRGPDGRGFWVDESLGVALGHLRLSILDLSHFGAQPMQSPGRRYWIVYNGEIYNAPTLREALVKQGVVFQGTSDTEVLLAGIEVWGLPKTLEASIGMFAFALWDVQERTLTLARDRLGVKPLYYGHIKGVWFFGSQLRSFIPHPSWEGRVDEAARSTFFSYNYLPEDFCIYQNIQKVPPGSFVVIDANGKETLGSYWSLKASHQDRIKDLRRASSQESSDFIQETLERCEGLLEDSIALRQLSDVPLGAFLSGGIDSSLVVALMQKHSRRPIKTFSIGFDEPGYNEAPFALKIARHLGTDHYEQYVTAKDAMSVIPSLADYYDEPFADSSQIPTFLVSRMARQQVTVSLSGDGGDELFGGYTRYRHGANLERILSFFPKPTRKSLAWLLAVASRPHFEPLMRGVPGTVHLSHKLSKLSGLLQKETVQEIYESLLTQWPADEIEKMTGVLPRCPRALSEAFKDSVPFQEAMMRADIGVYLPSDILVKVDRASMAHGLEAREPLLDHRLLELAMSLPLDLKIHKGKGKWLLRKILEKYVPMGFFDRPKQGFGLPIDRWLKTGLREWAESLLSVKALEDSGFKDSDLIHKRWRLHQTGQENWAYPLWGLLMYQAWFNRYQTALSK